MNTTPAAGRGLRFFHMLLTTLSLLVTAGCLGPGPQPTRSAPPPASTLNAESQAASAPDTSTSTAAAISAPVSSASSTAACSCPAAPPIQVPKKRIFNKRKAPVEPEPVPAPPPPPPVLEPATRALGPAPVTGILGKRVVGPKGDDLGRIVDVLIDDRGESHAAIIDIGGFLGVGNRKIAVDWALLKSRPDAPQASMTLTLSREQIQKAPEYKDGAHPKALLLIPVVKP